MGTDVEVERALPAVAPGKPTPIEIRNEPYLARLESSSPTGTGRLLLTSLTVGPFPSRLSGEVIMVGLVGMILGLPLLWLGGYRLQRALSHLSEAMAATATSGRLEHDLDKMVVDRWSAPEVGRLAHSFQSLMRTVEQSLRDRERSYVEAVGAVVAAIDARDHETTGHSFRVAHYALALARRLDVDGERLRAIEWGALLHDVGKIAVPDAILRKAGQLDEEEWHVMRQHPNWGFEMLADVQFLGPALEIVYSHHERWDGGGYPRGLEREQIPLAARIFAVVDTYDSITSDRPYRHARGHAEAVNELCRVAGTQLDPDVVEAFIRIPEVELRRLRERSTGIDLSARIPDAITELPVTGAYYGA
jgi:putative nucleotidyltransferase with HDIG domain